MRSPITPHTNNSHRGWRHRAGLAVEAAGWLVLAVTLISWVALQTGDLWPPSTLLMFGPRWVLVLLPALLLPAAVAFRARALWPVVPALLVAVGPVAGCCVPWEQLGSQPPAGSRLRVLSCNMHFAKVDSGPLDNLVEGSRPDVIAIQEWRDSARSEVFLGDGWHTHRAPGLFLASRYPICRSDRLGNSSTSEQGSVMRYELDTPDGPVTVFNLHFATPRKGLGSSVGFEQQGLSEIRANSELRKRQSEFVAAEASRVTGPVLLVGDFNTPPESVIFRRIWSGYANAFSDAGWGWGYTFRSRRIAVRIDHILVGGGKATKCWVGPDVGSPHRPLLADVVWRDDP
ncbi:MAG: endonuclease/exonuclease/phosphatase family protein [Planctomycetia bacterium]|nr:endonuclease/exonuclease/phosphatase family protein [Planctomycetia bacterium]